MTTAITYDHTRARTTEHVYDVEVGGVIVAAANNYSAAEAVALEVEARETACAFAGCIQKRTHADTGFCCYHNEEETGSRCDCEDSDWADAAWEHANGSYNGATSITVEGMELHAPLARCQEPDDLCSVDDPCPAHAAAAAAYLASEGPSCPCGRGPAIFFVQYPHKSYGYCCDCYTEQTQQQPPLLAQCAAVIRRCLGRTTGAGEIIEELRRVDQALRMEGW